MWRNISRMRRAHAGLISHLLAVARNHCRLNQFIVVILSAAKKLVFSRGSRSFTSFRMTEKLILQETLLAFAIVFPILRDIFRPIFGSRRPRRRPGLQILAEIGLQGEDGRRRQGAPGRLAGLGPDEAVGRLQVLGWGAEGGLRPRAGAQSSNRVINPRRRNRRPGASHAGFAHGAAVFIVELQDQDLPVLSALLRNNLKRVLIFWSSGGKAVPRTGRARLGESGRRPEKALTFLLKFIKNTC